MRPQTSAPYPMTRLDHLGPEVVDEVVALAGLATRTDGAAPIAEHVLLLLRRPQARLRHLLLRGPAGELAGYANLDLTDPAAGIGVELVVHPAHRRPGARPGAAGGGRRRDRGRRAADLVARRPPLGGGPRRRPRFPPRADALAAAPAADRAECPAPLAAGGVEAARIPAGRRRRGVARAQRPRVRRASGAGRWTADDLRRADGRAVVRPGRIPAGRRRETARWSASTGPRCTADPGARAARSARSTCSASTRTPGAAAGPGADPRGAAPSALARAGPR